MSSAYGFTEDSARRIARVVKAVEGDTTEPTRIGPMLGGSTMSVVKVTALGSPLCTGQRVDYHASANTMNDINEVKIRELNGATLTVGQRYIGQFSGYTSGGLPVFVVKTQVVSGGGSTFEVVTGVVCSNGNIGVTTASLTTSDFDGAVYKSFLGLVDVVPKSFVGNASRIVLVNATANALEFGPNFSGAPSAVDFLGLTDSPNSYSSGAYKTVIVNSGSSGLSFVSPNVSTTKSITGGGNPNDTSVFTTLQLSGDQSAPGNYYAYGTNGSGVKGWYENQAQPSGLKVGGNIVVSGRKAAVADVAVHTISSANLATTASTTQTAIDDLTTQVNLLLARIRSHGLIS
jgi:hypothetical protein